MKPIGIEVNGEFLDFEGSIRIKLVNPMFQQDSIPGISSFPFDLPGTPTNKRLFDFFNLAEDSKYINIKNVVIFLYGNVFLRGGLKYKWVKDKFEAEFSQVMTLYENKDKFLNTIALGEYDMENQDGYNLFYTYLKDRSADSYSGDKDIVLFPQYNPSLFNTKATLKGSPSPYPYPSDTLLPLQYAQYLNYYDYHEDTPGFPNIRDFWFMPNGGPDRTNEFAISPSYYIKNLTTKLFEQNGFIDVQGGDFFNVTDVDKIVMTSDKFFRMRVNFTSPGGTPQWRPLFLDWPDYIFKQEEYLPDVTIINYLNAIKNTFNLSYFFGMFNGKVEILRNETILSMEEFNDWTSKCFLLHERESVIQDVVTFNYTLSDDALNSNINTSRKLTILPSVYSYTLLPAVSGRDKICLVRNENNYYEQEYGLTGVLEWRLYGQENVDYNAVGADDRKSGSDTWHVANQLDQIEGLPCDNLQPVGMTAYAGKKTWRVPQGEFAGNSNRYMLREKNGGYIRLLFYRGMQEYVDHYNNYIPGSSLAKYPFATNDEFDTAGLITGSLSLMWNGNLGLYEQWWKTWINQFSRKVTVRRAIELTLDDILTFDFKKKIMIDGIKYYWESGDIIISSDKGIQPAVADFIKVNTF